MKSFKTIFAVLILCLIFQISVNAQTKTWVGPSGGSWGTATNWSPMGVPTSQIDVFIPSGSEIVVNVNAQMGNLTVQSGAVINKTTDFPMTMTSGNFEAGTTLNFMAGNINSNPGSGGGIVFDGVVNINGPLRKRFGAGNVTINNAMNVEDGVFDFNLRSNVVTISPGAVMTVSNGLIKIEAFNATLRNEGLIQKTTGNDTFSIETAFENDNGTINVSSGSMILTRNATLTNGTYNVNSNGFFQVGGNATHFINGTLTGQLDGPFVFNTNNFRVTNNAENFLDFTGPAGVEWRAGALSAQAAAGTVLVNKGLLTVFPPQTNVTQLAGGVVFRNEGDITVKGTGFNLDINQGSIFENTSEGVINLEDNASIRRSPFINNGLIDILDGNASASIEYLTNNETGILRINSGELNLVVTYEGIGLITGEGTIIPGQSSANISSTIAPGINGVGTLTYNNQTEFDSTEDCVYQLEINGTTPDTEHDVFAIIPDAKLNGTIDIQLGFAPQLNDEFVVITANEITVCNLPAQVTGFFDGMAYTYDVVCNTDNVTLRVVDIALGIDENTLATATAFPNPTNDMFTIDLGESYSEVNTTITNILGQVVALERFVNTNILEMNLQGAPGIYFVTLTTGQGALETLKIIKN